MEVWYQSPYPDDAARLPKLYLCEFCLRYQKSEVGMKRHAAKCVWRHPPGDEVANHTYFNLDFRKLSPKPTPHIKLPIVSHTFSDLPQKQIRRVAGGWKTTKAVLPAFMFAGQILS